MIFGIGCDLCGTERLLKTLGGAHGAHFAQRVFGPAERAALGLCGDADTRTARESAAETGAAQPCGQTATAPLTRKTAESAAADFAAKEAFLKAAGTGLSGPFALCEIEAVRLASGAPEYRFSGKSAQWMREKGLAARLSLSHENGMALAFCVLETAEKQ